MTNKDPRDRYVRRVLRRLRADRRGNALIELGLIAPVLLLLSIGTFEVGIHLDRYLHMQHIARSTANMYSRGIDFSLPTTKARLVDAMNGLPIVNAGGEGVIYVSRVVVASAGVNVNRPVISERMVIGDSDIGDSRLGMPAASVNGNVVDYENQAGAVATLPADITMSGTQELFIAEVLHEPNDLRIAGFVSGGKLYGVAYF